MRATAERDEGKEFAIAAASILNDTKCNDIVVLDVSPFASWTSYMVFCGVFSKPQLNAAMARVEKMASEEWGRHQRNVPGNSPWECLDFGDTIVHVMSLEQVRWMLPPSLWIGTPVEVCGASMTGTS